MASKEKLKTRSRRSWYPRHEDEKRYGFWLTAFYHKGKDKK